MGLENDNLGEPGSAQKVFAESPEIVFVQTPPLVFAESPEIVFVQTPPLIFAEEPVVRPRFLASVSLYLCLNNASEISAVQGLAHEQHLP